MKIGVFGAGYVGLITGACLADEGNSVVIKDIDEKRITNLQNGIMPFFEEGLESIIHRTLRSKNLILTTNDAEAVYDREVIFIAVGTPEGENGTANLTYVFSAAESIKQIIKSRTHKTPIVVSTKSTVPVGTGDKIYNLISEDNYGIVSYASVPEFLQEGKAVVGFLKPDRVVVGTNSEYATNIMRELFNPFTKTGKPIRFMSVRAAEMTKYVANTALAARISFMNEVAGLCERLNVNIDDVRIAIGDDSRIGPDFLFPGIGYGGSCFPKDVKALVAMGRECDLGMPIAKQIDTTNEQQPLIFAGKIIDYYNSLGKCLEDISLTVWGLSFKVGSDDMRESPVVKLIDKLRESGITRFNVHDSIAIPHGTAKRVFGDSVAYFEDQYDALNNCDGLIIGNDQRAYRIPIYLQIKKRLSHHVIFDGKDLLKPTDALAAKIDYISVGRPPILAR